MSVFCAENSYMYHFVSWIKISIFLCVLEVFMASLLWKFCLINKIINLEEEFLSKFTYSNECVCIISAAKSSLYLNEIYLIYAA